MNSKYQGRLYFVGIVCTVYGLILLKKGFEGDTLMPGTQSTYLPRWLFYLTGILLQIPLVAMFLWLRSLGNL